MLTKRQHAEHILATNTQPMKTTTITNTQLQAKHGQKYRLDVSTLMNLSFFYSNIWIDYFCWVTDPFPRRKSICKNLLKKGQVRNGNRVVYL